MKQRWRVLYIIGEGKKSNKQLMAIAKIDKETGDGAYIN